MVLSASAQEHKWFIGGQVGFWSTKQSYDIIYLLYPDILYPNSMKTTQIVVAPEIGYNISDKFAIAASLGYISIKTKYYYYTTHQKGFIFSPYARYTFLKTGILSAFIDGGATFGLSDYKGFQGGISPGIAVALTNRFSLVANFGFLGYNDGKGVIGSENGKGFRLDLSGYQSQFGFYYSF